MGAVTPDLLPPVIATAVLVLLLVLGALRVAAAYRKVRSKLRLLSRTRLVVTQTARRRKGGRR
ncbi:hypothetical protein KIK06_25130 [Nocardiopsis sp. EMB25]|uniref:hypothetical protein n=1 Tax=Nocardiopsis sp. EMB25 TaxID=2835867 RepID=UPI002284F95F|nr:hypothetical protein [Nocardiopsis sp. EMB25]MCY9787171.1 hypothetical protein [Nocardiopsis sp. EMB25]